MRTKISPKTGRGLGHVTHTILAVRSAILATAWLLVSNHTTGYTEYYRYAKLDGKVALYF